METLHMVFGIQAGHPEFLVVEVSQLKHQQRCQISWSCNALILTWRKQHFEEAEQGLHFLWNTIDAFEYCLDILATGRQPS